MQVLKSFNVVILLPNRFGGINQLWTVYQVQRVIALDTSYGNLLDRTENNYRDFVLPVLVLYRLPRTVGVRSELQRLSQVVLLRLGLLVGGPIYGYADPGTIPSQQVNSVL